MSRRSTRIAKLEEHDEVATPPPAKKARTKGGRGRSAKATNQHAAESEEDSDTPANLDEQETEDLQQHDNSTSSKSSPKRTARSKASPKARSSVVVAVSKMDTKQIAKAVKRSRTASKKRVSRTKGSARKSSKRSSKQSGRSKPAKIKKSRKAKVVLEPRPNLTSYSEDPFFETTEKVPFVSVVVDSKQVIRAALLGDNELMEELVNDRENVYSVCMARSIADKNTALYYAIKGEHVDIVRTLIKAAQEDASKVGRVKPLESLLAKQATGQYNFHMLGHAVRSIHTSRGAKEGNNALLKDLVSLQFSYAKELTNGLDINMSSSIADLMIAESVVSPFVIHSNIHHAIRAGHRKLAHALVEKYGQESSWNVLHKEVLSFDKQPLTPFRAVSVKKKAQMCRNITPLHCACINPNPDYLRALLEVDPDTGYPDDNSLRPVHYAAACEGPGPLKLLISKNVSLFDTDKQRNTPLHVACSTGRFANVKELVTQMLAVDKAGIFLKLKNRKTLTCLHIATIKGHLVIVKYLVSKGADIEHPTGASRGNVTPLMIAAQLGYMDIAEYLVSAGAKLNSKDHFKRTPVCHAAMNGQTPMLSYLLRLGANADLPDSSGNAPVHYAAAYGWWYCLDLLIEAGASLNIPNAWKLTPLAVAYLKGHMGLVELLLRQPGIDINCCNENGVSLVSLTVGGFMNSAVLEQLRILLEKYNADVSNVDSMGNNSLHHLAVSQIVETNGSDEECKKAICDAAEMLIQRGCEVEAVNEMSYTPFMLAVKSRNIQLANLLLQHGKGLHVEADRKENALHTLFGCSTTVSINQLFQLLLDHEPDSVRALLKRSVGGYTPFLYLCRLYATVCQTSINASNKASKQSKGGHPSRFNRHGSHQLAEAGEERRREVLEILRMLIDFDPACLDQQVKVMKIKVAKDDEPRYGRRFRAPRRQLASFDQEKIDKAMDLGNQKRHLMTAFHLLAEIKQQPHGGFDISSVNSLNNDAGSGSASTGLDILLDCYQKYKAKLTRDPLAIRDSRGFPPLYFAIKKNNLAACCALIHAGASIRFAWQPAGSVSGHYIDDEPAKINGDGDNTSDISDYEDSEDEEKVDQVDEMEAVKRDKEFQGRTVLMAAINRGLVSLVVLIVSQDASTAVATDSNGNTPLHFAAGNLQAHGMAGVVTILLKNGAAVNARNADGRTPLHHAANADVGATDVSHEVIELLLANHADPFSVDKHNRYPLHYAFVKYGDHSNATEMDPVALVTLLLNAMQNLLSKRNQMQTGGVVGAYKLDLLDKFNNAPAHYAAQRGATISCMMFSRHKVPVDYPRSLGDGMGAANSPLANAVYYKHMHTALLLIQAGADVDGSVHQFGPVFKSIDEYWARWTWTWLPKRPSPPSNQVWPIMHWVVKNEWQGVLYVALDLLESKVDSTGASFGYEGLIRAAFETKKFNLGLTLLRMVQRRNIDLGLNGSKGDNATLMQILAKNAGSGDEESDLILQIAKLLGGVGVDLHKHTGDHPHAIFSAAKHVNLPLMHFYLNQPAPASTGQSSAEYYGKLTAENGHTIFSMLLWDMTDEKLMNKAIEYCKKLRSQFTFDPNVTCNYPEIVDIADDHPKVGEVVSLDKTTPLIHAIRFGNFKVAKFLVLHLTADINAADSKGYTPLVHAILHNDLHMVQLLLDPRYVIPPVGGDTTDDAGHDQDDNVFSRRLFQSNFEKDDDDDDDDDGDQSDTPNDEDDEDDESDQEDEKDHSDIDSDFAENEVNNANDDVDTDDADSDATEQLSDNEDVDVNDDSGKSKKARTKKSKVQVPSFPSQLSRTLSLVNREKLSLVDGNGESVLQYVVNSLKYGSWENMEMLNVLRNAGMSMDAPAPPSMDPFTSAVENGMTQFVDAFQNTSSTPARSAIVRDTVCKQFSISNPIKVPNVDSVTPDEDAELLRAKSAAKLSVGQASMEERKPRPHSLSGYELTGDLVKDQDGHLYTAVMRKVDVEYGTMGYYNFYRLQLIKRRSSELYVLFTNWGRIGDEGQYQKTPFTTLEEGAKEFCKVFKSKTGNDWNKFVASGVFEAKNKKYQLQEEQQYKKPLLTDLKMSLRPANNLKSALPEDVQNIVKDLGNIDKLIENTKSIKTDRNASFVVPFGQILHEVLDKGFSCLERLEELIKKLEAKRSTIKEPKKFVEEFKHMYEQIVEESNGFYSLIQFDGFENMQLPVIVNSHAVRQFKEVMNSLYEMEVAGKLIAGATFNSGTIHPLDYIYAGLGTQFELLPAHVQEMQYILHYIWNTSPGVRVKRIIKLYNENKEKKFDVKSLIGNRRMLWHGSAAVNMLSILRAGLVPAATAALHRGHLFGKGIYTSDCFAKSQGYCQSSAGGNKYILLCEAALGKVKYSTDMEEDADMLGNKFDSLCGYGRRGPDPHFDVTLPTGVRMPLGSLVDQPLLKDNDGQRLVSYLEHNEFVLYDPSQVISRYLIIFK